MNGLLVRSYPAEMERCWKGTMHVKMAAVAGSAAGRPCFGERHASACRYSAIRFSWTTSITMYRRADATPLAGKVLRSFQSWLRSHAHYALVLKYLARSMTGGPISDWRLVSHDDGIVTFSAADAMHSETPREHLCPNCNIPLRVAARTNRPDWSIVMRSPHRPHRHNDG